MFFARILLFTLVVPLVVKAQSELTPQDYEGLSRRFVSTIKETQVDTQMLSVPSVQSCVERNRIEESDLQDPQKYRTGPGNTEETKAEKKRREARECFLQAMSGASDADLQNLANQLQLDQFGLVKGKSTQELTNFFTTRIQSAIYGAGSAGEDRRLRDRTIVDHNVYLTLYESRVSKNFLLEVSRYCSQDLLPVNSAGVAFGSNDPAYYIEWKSLLSSPNGDCKLSSTPTELAKKCLSNRVSDAKPPRQPPVSTSTPAASAAATTAPDPYLSFSQVLQDPSVGTIAPDDLRDIFIACLKIIPQVCELKVYCDSWPKDSTGNRIMPVPQDLAARYPQFQDPSISCPTDVKFGEKSCALQQKIRGYRVNIAALAKIKSENGTIDADRESDKLGRFDLKNPQEVYTNESAAADRSVEAVTTVTSSEISGTIDEINNKYAEKYDEEGCAQRPEDKKCEAFFYSNEEATRFANQGLLYDAATEREKASIKKLSGDELKTYLTEKGYTDLKARLESGASETDIVKLAQDRFSAERDASYGQMADAFKDKQLIGRPATGTDSVDEVATTSVKKFQDANKQISQLLLFNNVVTSFITTEDERGQQSSNTGVLRRELQSDNIDPTALEFFQNLAGPASSGSEEGGNQTITVDRSFLDRILSGADEAAPR